MSTKSLLCIFLLSASHFSTKTSSKTKPCREAWIPQPLIYSHLSTNKRLHRSTAPRKKDSRILSLPLSLPPMYIYETRARERSARKKCISASAAQLQRRRGKEKNKRKGAQTIWLMLFRRPIGPITPSGKYTYMYIHIYIHVRSSGPRDLHLKRGYLGAARRSRL